ncbi:MAG: Ppx/GppA phosphatase family protein, partial [Actinomycetota bacterium]
VEVISGLEEARLIHLGVLQALPVYDQRLLLVDIGGGSTEFLVGEGSEVLEARSMKLGAIRLTERFFADGEAKPRPVRRCSAHIAATLTSVAAEFQRHEPQVAIGSSGTIGSIASMVAAARGEEIGDLNGFTFSADELADLTSTVVDTDAADRRRIPGLDDKRADIIVGGVLLLEGIFDAFGIEEMTVSGYALREGVLFDRMAADRERSARRLTDLRRSNALRLARQLDPDAAHAETAARLALSLFDQTASEHGLGPSARELLELAAIVHNVGLFISHAAHHKHTYYVVRHSEQLTGFTERERELLALIARYHRRSHPKPRHPEFAALAPDDQDMVRKLSGILRIAIGLDRSHRGLVDEVEVSTGDDGQLVVTPRAEPGIDLDLEVFSALERAHLLAEAL